VEAITSMNHFFTQPVIQDREREVATFSKYNQKERYSRDSAGSHSEPTRKITNVVIYWFSQITKWFKDIFAVKTDDNVNALK
jgi:hypothetical protein